jgi:PPOX class probable F420-dependent enzyme
VPGGSCARLSELPLSAARVVEECRRAVLSTRSGDGTAAVVPVCFALSGEDVVTAIDGKPKGDAEPARLGNVRRDRRVTMLFDRWDEDWTRLGWVMVKGTATIESAGDSSGLVARYPQYRTDPPRGPLLVVSPDLVRWWTWTSGLRP